MTDFLTRLAARITAPESGLRPNAPTRFEPTPGLAGEAGLFEVDEEREVRAPAMGRAAAAAPERTVPQAIAPPLATPNASAPMRAASDDASAAAGSVPPVPDTLAAVQTAEATSNPRLDPRPELPSEYSRGKAPAEPGDPAFPPHPPTTPQPTVTRHTVERHYHRERVIERVAPTDRAVAAGQAAAVTLPASRSSDETAPPDRRPATPTQAPPPDRPSQPAPPARDATARDPAQPAREPSREPPQPAPVVVRIDRLEVRVAPPRPATAPSAARQGQPAAAPDLDRYLSGLDGRRS